MITIHLVVFAAIGCLVYYGIHAGAFRAALVLIALLIAVAVTYSYADGIAGMLVRRLDTRPSSARAGAWLGTYAFVFIGMMLALRNITGGVDARLHVILSRSFGGLVGLVAGVTVAGMVTLWLLMLPFSTDTFGKGRRPAFRVDGFPGTVYSLLEQVTPGGHRFDRRAFLVEHESNH